MDISTYRILVVIGILMASSLILDCTSRRKYRKLERIQKKICQALKEAGYPIKEDKGVGYRYSMRDKDD